MLAYTPRYDINQRLIPYGQRHFLLPAPVTSLYKSCIRLLCYNFEFFDRLYDLSQLPSTVKADLIVLNMKPFCKGFHNEKSFIQLLSSRTKALFFVNSPILTDLMLKSIGEQCTELKQLQISAGKYNFSCDGLCNSFDLMQNLQILHISGSHEVNNEVIEIITKRCGQLRSLWLNDCSNVIDKSATALKRMQLVELNLGNTNVTDTFLHICKDSVLMEHLRDICLKNCSITQDGLQDLNWDRLENVNIVGTAINDLSFIPPTAVYKTLNWSI